MSKIVELQKVTETVTHVKKIKVGVKCDVCCEEIKGDYWRITTHHHDWGNESCDSYEHYDVCGKDCMLTMLNGYLENCKRSHTQEFEIEQELYKVNVVEDIYDL